LAGVWPPMLVEGRRRERRNKGTRGCTLTRDPSLRTSEVWGPPRTNLELMKGWEAG